MVTTTFASPLGEILLAADGRGLTGLWFERQEHFGSTLLKEDEEYVVGDRGRAFRDWWTGKRCLRLSVRKSSRACEEGRHAGCLR